jgi:hypothetical protein
MARQSINVNPGFKEFEAYMDFSGGLNTETSNERLNENEFTQMQNVELNTRGSVKKRTGRSDMVTTGLPINNPQGVFFFYRKNRDQPDLIVAANGRLYVKKYNATASFDYETNVTQISITGMTSFQTTKIVEAVQYYNTLYVATGTNIVVVTVNETNGVYSANIIQPYEPNTNELKYIGTNALLLDNSNGVIAMQNTIDNFNNVNQFSVKGMAFTEEGTGKTLINAQTKERFTVKAYVVENPSITVPPGEFYFKVFSFYYKKVQSEKFETRTYTAVNTVTDPQTQFAVGATSVVTLPTGSSYDINTSSMEVSLRGTPLVTGVTFTETNNTQVTVTPPAANPIVAGDKVTLKWIPSWWSGNSQYGSFTQVGGLGSNEFVFRPLEVGFYDFKIEVRFGISNTTSSTKEYVYQGLQSKAFREDGDILEQTIAGARKCNRIRLYYDRLMLFGDPDEPTQLYFSDINNPEYFPQVNCLRFDTGKQEPITTVVRLNDYLVVFSKSLIHILTGKTKDEFSINLINDTVGCIAPKSAVVTGNVVTFLSDEGVYALRPSTFKLDQLNVKRVDGKVKDEILKSENACALAYDSQYWLCYPDSKKIYRYY